MRLRTVAFRAHNPKWAFEPASGEGAKSHGGRFNPVDRPALYLSFSYKTAILEAMQGFISKIKPLTIVAYDVDAEPIADLSTAESCDLNGIDPKHLSCAWLALHAKGEEVPSWRVANHLQAKGFCGLIAPSFAPGSTQQDLNLVLFEWSDTLPSKIIPYDPDDHLPKNQKSWEDD